MSRKPRIPMLPSQLPQQRLVLVRGLPPRPPGWATALGEAAQAVAPGRMPGRARYLGQVEWAWSPMNSRLDAYYLSQCSHHRHWVLWLRFFDDNWGRWDAPIAVAASPRCRLPAPPAGRLLLHDFWMQESGQEVGRFHWVNEDGLLGAGALKELGDRVWEPPASRRPPMIGPAG